jgi:hypothetical protein
MKYALIPRSMENAHSQTPLPSVELRPERFAWRAHNTA